VRKQYGKWFIGRQKRIDELMESVYFGVPVAVHDTTQIQ
jgi:hypothetical protein